MCRGTCSERLGHHGGDGDVPGSVAAGRGHGEGGEAGGCARGIAWLSKRLPFARAMGCAPRWHPGPQSHARALQCGGRGHTAKPPAVPHLRSPASAVHLVPCLCLITQVQRPLPEIGDSKMMLFFGAGCGDGVPNSPGQAKILQKEESDARASCLAQVRLPSLQGDHDTLQKSSGKHIQPILTHSARSVAFSILPPPWGRVSPQSHPHLCDGCGDGNALGHHGLSSAT